MTIGSTEDENYDRAKEVKEFDDSKIGVKGLVDSGITSIPRFFIHPPETVPRSTTTITNQILDEIPIIDLSGVNSDRRSTIVDQIRESSRTWGFFQIINHGIPLQIQHRLISSIKSFYNQSTVIKSQHYSRDAFGRGVSFSTNLDLFKSKAASWRDTLTVRLGPTPLNFDEVPEICRREIVEWDQEIQRLGETLMGILSEGLGLDTERLKEMTCLEGRVMVAHCYPYCPEPDRTVGIASHTDPGVLTVLIQNEIGGLQVKKGENWVDVKPVEGALVINIGDILQIMSNDEYKSVEHWVLANPFQEPRISIAIFFNPSKREDLYGPIPDLISPEKPSLYQQFTLSEFMRKRFTRELDAKSLINHFKL